MTKVNLLQYVCMQPIRIRLEVCCSWTAPSRVSWEKQWEDSSRKILESGEY